MANAHPNNRREEVDDITKALAAGDTDLTKVTGTLMQSFRTLENNSHAERDALKTVLASNVILAKAVGTLSKELQKLQNILVKNGLA